MTSYYDLSLACVENCDINAVYESSSYNCVKRIGPPDCEGVSAGAATEDVCGVCNGDGTSCGNIAGASVLFFS